MKAKFIAILCGITFITGCSQNSEKTTADIKEPVAITKTVRYKCPQCGYGSDTTGDCPKDKISLVKIGYYYCPDCFMSDSVPGKCKMCGVEMKKME